VSGWWPTRTPAWMHSTEMKRAKMCAVVMKSRVEAPSGSSTTSSSATAELRHSSTKFECVSTQPFGRPVEPEV
jgi:hypothetical protein